MKRNSNRILVIVVGLFCFVFVLAFASSRKASLLNHFPATQAAPVFSIVMFAGWPVEAEVKKTQRDKTDTTKFEMELTRYMRSVVFSQDCPTELIVVTNPTGTIEVQRIWDSLSTHGQVSTIKMVAINISEIFEWTKNELVPRGVAPEFASRIWHWPKWWIKRILERELSPPPRFIAVLDIDAVILQSLCGPVNEVFEAMERDGQCFAVVDQWTWLHAVPTVNAGMMYMDLQCFPKEWYSSMVSEGVNTSLTRHTNNRQWPPEQWLYSSMFDTFPQYVKKLSSRYHRHCAEDRWNNTLRLNSSVLYLHWCADREPLVLPPKDDQYGPVVSEADVQFTKDFFNRLDAAVTVIPKKNK